MALTRPRWTHVAIPSSDLERSIEFYTQLAPLVVVHRREDELSQVAWLSNDGQVEDPFVLVVVMTNADRGTPQPVLTPFAHLGIELPSREEVDAIAARGRELGCLDWEPADLPDPIGYLCSLRDPDGNIVEFSHNQGVYSTVRELWGDGG